jgi:hypothetical protein
MLLVNVLLLLLLLPLPALAFNVIDDACSHMHTNVT